MVIQIVSISVYVCLNRAENDNILGNISPGHIPTGFDLQRNLWRTEYEPRTVDVQTPCTNRA